MNSLVLIAITHKTADIDDLERVTLDQTEASGLARELIESSRIEEAVVVSTCNRTEIYLAGPKPDIVGCSAFIAEHVGISPAHLGAISLTSVNEEASRHLFTVAAGLDSRLVGEREILGQIRSAIGRAKEDATAGPLLESLFRYAIAAGRRARRMVASAGVPSLAAISLDTTMLGASDSVLVIGAGAVAAALAGELDSRQLGYSVVARRVSQAERLAPHPEHAYGFASLTSLMEEADVVFVATGARAHILSHADVVELMERRGGRPLTVVDLALPRNIDPDSSSVEGVTLLDLSDLNGDSLGRYPAQTEAIEVEHRRYLQWLAGQSGADLIGSLRRHVYELCLGEIMGVSGDLGLDNVDSRRLARRISGKILHAPTVALKEHLMRGNEAAALAILTTFGAVAHNASRDETSPLTRVS